MTNRNFCILYVDDDENDIDLVKLASEPAHVSECLRTVKSGPEAIDYLHGRGVYGDRVKFPLPKLILLDLRMPQMNGLELLRWLRGEPDYAGVVVIIFTSSAHPDDVRRAWELGANAFVQKPSTFAELVKFLQLLTTFWADFHQFLPAARPLCPLDDLPKPELRP